jgi:hypothetical protein
MPITGSYDTKAILEKGLIKSYFKMVLSRKAKTIADPYILQHYNIGRFQVWSGKSSICNGKYKASSCIYGIRDLSRLVQRAELAAHKFYMSIQPTAFFCLWKHVKDRAFDKNQQLFKGLNYQQLFHVKLNNGRTIEDLIREYSNVTL